MGMFDNLRYNGELYQTKDFECQMTDYWIEDGKLIASIGYYESTPKAERPYPDAPDDDFRSACGCIRWVETERRDFKFHGFVNFYRMATGDVWEEYNAKFTDGALIEVQRVIDEAGRAAAEGSADGNGESQSGAGSASAKLSDCAGEKL